MFKTLVNFSIKLFSSRIKLVIPYFIIKLGIKSLYVMRIGIHKGEKYAKERFSSYCYTIIH